MTRRCRGRVRRPERRVAQGAIVHADNLPVLRSLPDGCAGLIYTDPPFNTGRDRASPRIDAEWPDAFDDYLAFLEPRLIEMQRLLAPTGALYLHLDYREAHYVKVLLDRIFGRRRFLNEIIWAYDFGGRPKRRWPAKHDTILVYVQDPAGYTFNVDEIDRIPYMAPGLVGPEKAARGKLPTDVWWHTIVGTAAKERTGYPTQKPQALAERILRAASNPGDLVLDPFAGSGTVGAAADALGRRYLLIDRNDAAIEVIRARLPGAILSSDPRHDLLGE